jgi:DNA-binding response OmpR family regulator
MIVDDSKTFLLHIENILSSLPNVDIQTFLNPMEAIESLEDVMPDIIITDNEMPSINGDELCARVRSNDKFKKTPILMLTANYGDEALIKAIHAGADEYCCKSASPEAIRIRMFSMLRKRMWLSQEIKLQNLKSVKELVVTTKHEINNCLTTCSGHLQRHIRKNPEIDVEGIKIALNSIKDITIILSKLSNIEAIETEDYVNGTKMIKLGDK